MAIFYLKDVDVIVDGYDMSGFTNKVKLAASVAELDTTNFASSGAKARIGGLKDASVNVEGFYDTTVGTLTVAAGSEALYSNLGTSDKVISISPDGLDQSVVYAMRSLETDFSAFDAIGSITPFSISAATTNTDGLVRGIVANPVATARTATGNGSITDMGAGFVTATKRLAGFVQFVTISGTTPTCIVKIQSSTSSTFASGVTDRITFTSANTISSQWSTALTGTTDRYWRATWTITGTSPSFNFCAGFSIT